MWILSGAGIALNNVRHKRVTEKEIEKVFNCLGSVVGDMLRIIWYDLRRSMTTRTPATLGKEATKVLLGHAKTSTTEIYWV